MDKSKIFDFMNKFERRSTPYGDQFDFELGICYVLLEDYKKAQYFFEQTFLSMHGSLMFWKKSGQPDWLVNICILSRRLDRIQQVNNELEEYKTASGGDSPLAHYAYAIADLLSEIPQRMEEHIRILLKYPRFKITIPWGKAVQALLLKNQLDFEQAIMELLLVHKGQATHGDLRWTPEGWLCMSAMSLIYLA